MEPGAKELPDTNIRMFLCYKYIITYLLHGAESFLRS